MKYLLQWNKLMQQQDIDKKKKDQLTKDIQRGRTKLQSSTDFEGTHAVIAKPNFQYFREYFLDAYFSGPAPLLSSMIFEASMRDNKDACQHDSWKNINVMLPRVASKLNLNRRFDSILIDLIDSSKHFPIIRVLKKSVQRS